MPPLPTPPVIILVRPQMGENIGATARAMMNFGLQELRLVAPRDGWPNPKAHEMAAHADGIIEQARLFDTLDAALADRQFVIAASARKRDMNVAMLTPPEAATKLAAGRESALLFGPENNGLSNEDIARCQRVVSIPTHPANPSLNLAQSVGILGYSWWMAVHARAQDETVPEPPATSGEIDGLYTQLMHALEEKDYFSIPAKKTIMARNLRSMLTRAGFSTPEVRTLRGMVRALASSQ